jgi:hypothetical protein
LFRFMLHPNGTIKGRAGCGIVLAIRIRSKKLSCTLRSNKIGRIKFIYSSYSNELGILLF